MNKSFSIQETNIKKAWLVLGLFLLCAVIPAGASAQSDVRDKIDRLENEVETLSRALYRGDTSENRNVFGQNDGTPSSAAMEIRLQQLETELRGLRGTLEEQNFRIKKMEEKLETALGDMQIRFEDLEKPTNLSKPNDSFPMKTLSNSNNVQTFSWKQPNQQASTNKAQEILNNRRVSVSPKDDGTAAYETAFAYLKNNDYEEAADEFEEFIAQYPSHTLIANAKYWLGETYYVRGKYTQSSRIFAEGYKEFPRSPKAPDNLLKLGMSLSGMGNEKDACIAFKQLQKEFPAGVTPIIRRAEQEMTRIGCAS